MPLVKWKTSKEDPITFSDGVLATNSTKQWGRLKQVQCSGEAALLVVHDQVYRTGGMHRISIDGIGKDVDTNARFVKNVFRSRAPLMKRLEWLTAYSGDFTSEAEIEDVTEIYSQIDNLITPKGMVEVDELIEALKDLNLSYEIKAGILRYTADLRPSLPSWNTALHNLIEDLEREGFDAEGILLGLR